MTEAAGKRRRPPAKKAPANRPEGPSQVERLEELHETLAKGVEQLHTSAGWRQLMNGASRLRGYSANNILLLLSQKEDVQAVNGYRTWQSLGRNVAAGQKGLWILAPNTRRFDVEDKDTGDTQKVTKITGFRAIPVFDISQTTGPDLPGEQHVEGDAPGELWNAYEQVLANKGYRVQPTDIAGHEKGSTSRNGWVQVDIKQSRAEQLAVIEHETAHVFHGHLSEDVPYAGRHRGRMEVEAQGSAGIIGMAQGRDVAAFSIEYMASWSAQHPELVQETAGKVVRVAQEILDALDVVRRFGTEAERVGDVVSVDMGSLS